MRVPRAIALGLQSEIYVAGDRGVRVFSDGGQPMREILLGGEPSCIAVGGADHRFPGRVYVGIDNRVELYAPSGEAIGQWDEGFSENPLLTSIAVADEDVFVADAGNARVLRFDTTGGLINLIGEPDSARDVRGFVIPSPYFDIAFTPDGVLRVANPGALRIEAYTFEGDMLGYWGKASAHIDGFFGCCNPSNFTVLPDGWFVTAEKGIPRIKVCDGQGQLQAVVATLETLSDGKMAGDEIREGHQPKVFDVAASSEGTIFVLEPNSQSVRVFQPKQPVSGGEHADSPQITD
jgi:hypothetical protein